MKPMNRALNGALKGIVSLGLTRAKKRPAPALPAAVFDHLAAPKADHFIAGFGSAPVLPPDIDKAAYYIAGYGENNPARGVIDPQYVSALWLDDGSRRGGVLFLAVDAVGILNKDVNRLRTIWRISKSPPAAEISL